MFPVSSSASDRFSYAVGLDVPRRTSSSVLLDALGKSLEHDEVETKVVPRRLVLGMERQALLVGFQAALEGFRPQPVVEALDVIAFTARQPVGAFQRTLGVLVALVEEA